MKKILSFFTVLMIVLIYTTSLLAQTPQYYNGNTASASNSFPFNVNTGKAVNWLIRTGEIINPTPIPTGKAITTVYFRTSTAGTRDFTDLHILLAQSTITDLTSATFYAGPWDTVYFHPTTSLTSAANEWMSITLDHPFNYDPAQSLLIFVGQCGATGSGMSINQQDWPGTRRVWSQGGCPFVPYSSADARVVDFGVDVVDAVTYTAPELIYYKFEDNPSTTTIKNCATSPVGTNPATFTGQALGPDGQFDTCIIGAGAAGGRIATGWNCDLGSSSWTIGFWVKDLAEPSSGTPCYIFGDAGSSSFRCFYGGAAYPDNFLLRGPMSDITWPCTGLGPHQIYIVYDAANVIIYVDGTLVSTTPASINMPLGSGFYVAGYGASNYFVGKLDEFRLYNRALDAAEVAATWNLDIPGCVTPVGINNIYSNTSFELMQNYPNPFNQNTTISYQISSKSDVVLKVFDIMGKEVTTLVNANQVAGKYEVKFDASGLAAGIYVYQLTTKDFSISKRMNVEK